MLGIRNPREQIGYITVGLFAHCILDGKCKQVAIDSLATLINPEYVGETKPPDLMFQRGQEWDVLTRTLEQQGITVHDLLSQVIAGTEKPFFVALAKRAVLDAEYTNCRFPHSVRVRTVTPK